MVVGLIAAAKMWQTSKWNTEKRVATTFNNKVSGLKDVLDNRVLGPQDFTIKVYLDVQGYPRYLYERPYGLHSMG